MGDKLKKVLKITLITYMSLSFISGLFWFWFGGNLNFLEKQGLTTILEIFFLEVCFLFFLCAQY